MAYSKVIFNGSTLMDVTQKTVTAETLLQGETALKNDGTSITGTYVGGGGNYSITVSLTNPISASDFYYCNIYEAVNPDFEEAMDGTPLATISSATGSATVSISSTSYGIVVSPEGSWGATYADSNVSCTGKIIIAKQSSIFVTARMYLVGSDGTIVLDRIDYGD